MSYRFISIVLINVFFSIDAFSRYIDEATAKNAGRNFLISVGSNIADTATLTAVSKPTTMIRGINAVGYYAFNVIGGGFVIVAGDDGVDPILGYSVNTTFDTANAIAMIWMRSCHEQIISVIQQNRQRLPEVAAKWNELNDHSIAAKTTTGVSALLSTSWNQSPYYNDLCPYDSAAGTHAVTGCVATAMAQIMKYWNWPVTGCGSHSYIHAKYGVLGANFGATNYQWSSMQNHITGSDTTIARLMYDVGVSVNMEYGIGASAACMIPGDGSDANNSFLALKTYFHYKQSMKAVRLYNYSVVEDNAATAKWANMLREELIAGRPVLYAGSNSVNGHCWVCDGYQGNGFFHFNWGWGGLSDGYFTLNNLAAGLNMEHEAIVGIEPDSYPLYTGNIRLQSFLNTSTSPTAYAQPFSVSTTILNGNAVAFIGDLCAQILDSTGCVIGVIQTIPDITIAAHDSSTPLVFATNGMYQLLSGFYSIRIAYKHLGTNDWIPVANNGDLINYSVMSIADDKNPMLWEPITFAGDSLVHGKRISAKFVIRVLGNESFNGSIMWCLYNISTGEAVDTIVHEEKLSLGSYELKRFSIETGNLMVPTGQYILALKHRYNDTGMYYITGSSMNPNPIAVNVVAGDSKIFIYPNPVRNLLYVDCPGSTPVEIQMADICGRVVLHSANVAPGLVSIPVAEIANGMYFIKVYADNNVFTEKVIIRK